MKTTNKMKSKNPVPKDNVSKKARKAPKSIDNLKNDIGPGSKNNGLNVALNESLTKCEENTNVKEYHGQDLIKQGKLYILLEVENPAPPALTVSRQILDCKIPGVRVIYTDGGFIKDLISKL